jgi:hypothetical protein
MCWTGQNWFFYAAADQGYGLRLRARTLNSLYVCTWTEYEGGGTERDNDEADYEVSCRQAHDKHIRHLKYKTNLRKKYRSLALNDTNLNNSPKINHFKKVSCSQAHDKHIRHLNYESN